MEIIFLAAIFLVRYLAPTLFMLLATAFLVILGVFAFAGIKQKDFDWKKGITTSVYAIITLWLMFGM